MREVDPIELAAQPLADVGTIGAIILTGGRRAESDPALIVADRQASDRQQPAECPTAAEDAPQDLAERLHDLSPEERWITETFNEGVKAILDAALALDAAGFRLTRGVWRRPR